MLLEGEASAVWLESNEHKQKSYKDAKAKIIERNNPVQFVLTDDYHCWKLLQGKPLSEFVHEFKRLMAGSSNARRRCSNTQAAVNSLIFNKHSRAREIDDFEGIIHWANLLMTLKLSEQLENNSPCSRTTMWKPIKKSCCRYFLPSLYSRRKIAVSRV